MVDGDGTEEDATFSPVAGCTLGGWDFFCFWGPRPQERDRVRGWLTDCCSVNQLFQSFSRGSQGGIGAAGCAEAERSTCGNSVFLAGPRKPSPGADSGDCRGFLAWSKEHGPRGMVQGASEEVFPRAISGYGPRGVVQGAWSKGAWSNSNRTDGSTTTRTVMVQGGMVQGGMVQVLLGGELRKFGYL